MIRPRSVRAFAAVAALLGGLGAAASTAQAVAPCTKTATPSPLVSGRTWVESVAFDPAGRLLFTDSGAGALYVLDRPGGKPRVLAKGIAGPGGIAPGGKRYVYVGTGNTIKNGMDPALGGAGIVRVDLKTGKTKRVASGLAMANGLVRTSKGVFYASDDFKPVLDRVNADGSVDRGWLTFGDANGLALSADERYLYANRSLDPTKLVRIDLRSPAKVVTVAAAPAGEGTSFLDGLTTGPKDSLYAAVFGAGQVWRVQGGSFCRLAGGLEQATSLAFGRPGRGFDPKSLYVGTAKGVIVRLPKVG